MASCGPLGGGDSFREVFLWGCEYQTTFFANFSGLDLLYPLSMRVGSGGQKDFTGRSHRSRLEGGREVITPTTRPSLRTRRLGVAGKGERVVFMGS